MDRVEEKLRAAGLDETATATFRRLRARWLAGERGRLSSSVLEPVSELPSLPEVATVAPPLDALAIVKLNGGLGTSMGLRGPKSLVEVRPGLTFLDAAVAHVLALRRDLGVRLPLLLMGSFATRGATSAALAAHPELPVDLPLQFEQGVGLKLTLDGRDPVAWPRDPRLEWCPPGHGEVFAALRSSGVLAALLERGYRYAFVSNIDNLGAAVDPRVLGFMVAQRAPLVLELVAGTAADRKGGHLARRNGRLLVRETAQTPPAEADSFRDFRRWRFYSTNNVWLDLRALDRALAAAGGILPLPLVASERTVDPSDPSSPPVRQLETAMGGALGVLDGARALRVPRARFAPVKSTDDLLVLWSDAYALDEGIAQPTGSPPFVDLDRRFFRRLEDLRARFPAGPPSLARCRSLVVRGDVSFGAGVQIVGDVRLECGRATRIADGAVLTG